MFGSQERKNNFGLLVMRVGLAAVLLFHALPGLFGGTQDWQGVAKIFNFLNLGGLQALVGLIVLVVEALGAAGLFLGYFFRIACTLLFLLFGLNFFYYFSAGYQTLMLWSAAIAAVFLGLVSAGPGRYAIAVKLKRK
jgi:putative oxidoreductase